MVNSTLCPPPHAFGRTEACTERIRSTRTHSPTPPPDMQTTKRTTQPLLIAKALIKADRTDRLSAQEYIHDHFPKAHSTWSDDDFECCMEWVEIRQ